MFWGAISERGKIYFDVIEGKIDSKLYSNFLEKKVLPAIRKLHGDIFIL
jgi:hypothetical protein